MLAPSTSLEKIVALTRSITCRHGEKRIGATTGGARIGMQFQRANVKFVEDKASA